MPHNQTIKLYLHGLNGEYKFLIWNSTTSMPVPTLRADMRYRLEVYRDDTLTYACSPQSAEFVLGRLVELLLWEPEPLSNSPWQVQGIKLPGLPAVALTKDEDRAEDDLVFKNCEDWTDRLKAKHYRQLHSLGMTLERAESIIRKTGAK